MADRTRPARWAGLLVLAASALVLAGCGSAGTAPGRPPPSPTSAAGTVSPPPRATACGPGAHPFFLPGPGHTRLEANSAGAGKDAVVFLHESGPTGMCGFWPYARWLIAHERVQTVLVNRCLTGASTCTSPQVGDRGVRAQTEPAVAWARSHGATRVTLVGASAGASDALEAAGVVPGVDAVVDLSGDTADTGADDRVSARRLRVPALFAVAPQDPYSPIATVQGLYRLVPSRPKRLVVVRSMPGAHGWDLLFDAAGTRPPPARPGGRGLDRRPDPIAGRASRSHGRKDSSHRGQWGP